MKRLRLIVEADPNVDRQQEPERWEQQRLDYVTSLRQIVRVPLDAHGASLEELELSLRVLRALEGKQCGDLLVLEDADHAHLCDKVRSARWMVIDERVYRFVHAVLDAKEWPVDATVDERGKADAS